MANKKLVCVKCFTAHNSVERKIKTECSDGRKYTELMKDIGHKTYFTICPAEGCDGIWTLDA